MTPKAESLVDALIDASRETGSVVHEYHELSRYIEELERKARLLDRWQRFERLEHERIMYDVDGNPSIIV